MSTYVLHQKVRMLKRIWFQLRDSIEPPEALLDYPHPTPDFQGVNDTFAITSCESKTDVLNLMFTLRHSDENAPGKIYVI